jgi:lysophospholipase L1-like esterase
VRLKQYMGECRSVARELRVPLVDHFTYWTDHAAAGQDLGAWTTDQCHPNPAGHAVLTETMLPVIENLL